MFDLPEYLTLCTGALLLNMSRRNGNYWRSLIEILKFVNDYAGFAGPILLNGVVSFMEDPDPDSGMVTGYIYIRHSTRHLFLHWSFVFFSLQLVHDRARR